MRLVEESKHLEYKWRDVTFKVRAKATTGDAHALVTLVSEVVDVNKNGSFRIPVAKVSPHLIERFVVDWEGVTDEKGEKIPWSLENLYRLPADPHNDVVLLLGGFIANQTGIVPTQESEVKKKA